MATLQELVNAHEQACQSCADFVKAMGDINGDEDETITAEIASCAEQAKICMLNAIAGISKLIELKYENQ